MTIGTLLACALGSPGAAQEVNPTLQLPACQICAADPGANLCVPVHLESRGARVASIGFTIEYQLGVLRMLRSESGDPVVELGDVLNGGQALTAIATENNLTGEGNLQVIITPPIKIPIPVISDGDVARICFVVQPGANPGCQEASNVSFAPDGVDMGDDLGRNLTLDPPTDGGVCVSCVPPIAPVCVPEPAASLQHAAALAAIALLRRRLLRGGSAPIP